MNKAKQNTSTVAQNTTSIKNKYMAIYPFCGGGGNGGITSAVSTFFMPLLNKK